MNEQQKQKNKRVAAVSSLTIHGLLFILMFFIVAWVPMDPPLGEGSGVNLNLGFSDEGSGDIQPDEIGNDGKSDEPTTKSEAQAPPQDAVEKPEETEKAETKDDANDMTSESKEESPVTAPPAKEKEVKKTPTPEKSVEKPADKPAQVKQQVTPGAVYDPNAKKSSTATTAGEGKAGQGGNEGDDKGKTGDKGDPRGVKEGTVYEGNPGKGGPGPGGDGGFGLQMSGWTWDQKPVAPKVPDNESGFAVFEITVDEEGNITNVRQTEGTLSAEAVALCKKKIWERSFVRTANTSAPSRSVGTVRFELQVK